MDAPEAVPNQGRQARGTGTEVFQQRWERQPTGCTGDEKGTLTENDDAGIFAPTGPGEQAVLWNTQSHTRSEVRAPKCLARSIPKYLLNAL